MIFLEKQKVFVGFQLFLFVVRVQVVWKYHHFSHFNPRFEVGDEYIELKGDVLRDMLGGSTAAEPRLKALKIRG